MAGVLAPGFEATLEARDASGGIRIDCDPQLVEAAVFATVRNTPLEHNFQTAREVCYAVPDVEARDCAFAKLHLDWFARLSLARPVFESLAERPDISTRTARCVLAPAIRRQDECAELYGHSTRGPAERPYLVIRLRPESFGSPAHIVSLLCHELMHIQDMLDPHFGYDPSPSQFHDHEGVPTVIRDRYRVLWDTYIDGRLFRKGRTGSDVHAKRFSEFCRTFPTVGAQMAAVFDAVFDSTMLTHQYLIDCAHKPDRILECCTPSAAAKANTDAIVEV